MAACSALDCTNRRNKHIPGITFHKFPKDEGRRTEWIKALKRKNWYPSECSRVCSEHFPSDMIDRSLNRVLLKPEAVPRIFKSFPTHLQKVSHVQKTSNSAKDQGPTNVMVSCAVLGCKNIKGRVWNRPDEYKPGVSFHVFPSDEPRRSKWIKAVGRHNWLPKNHSIVCSEHFREGMFDRTMNMTILRPNAVPTIFPADSHHLQKGNKNIEDNKAFCFILKCSTGLHTSKEKQGLGQKNLSLFYPPQDPVEFEKWKKVMPRGYAELTSSDQICELHFADDDIVRYDIAMSPDGSVKKVKRENSVLRPGAVPYFSNLPPHLAKEAIKLKQLILQNSDDEVQPISTENVVSPNKENGTNYVFDLQIVSLATNFKKAVQSIKVPGPWWGVNSTPEFIICAKWDASFSPEKRVVIDKDLNVKVFIKDLEVKTDENLKISTAGDISCLLREVDSYVQCEGINDESATNCMKYLKKRSKSMYSSWCDTCQVTQRKIQKVIQQRKRRAMKRLKKVQCLDLAPTDSSCLRDLPTPECDSVITAECLRCVNELIEMCI